jgi:hypothetical protein
VNNLDDKTYYIASIRLILEDCTKNYTPQVIRNLSKDMFDLYSSKKGVIDDVTSMLEDPNFDIEGFKNLVNEKLNATIENAKFSSENLPITNEEVKIEIYKKILEI